MPLFRIRKFDFSFGADGPLKQPTTWARRKTRSHRAICPRIAELPWRLKALFVWTKLAGLSGEGIVARVSGLPSRCDVSHSIAMALFEVDIVSLL